MADKTVDDVVGKTPRQSELEVTRQMIGILNARLAGSLTDEDRRFNLEKIAVLRGREAELLDLVDKRSLSDEGTTALKTPPEVSPIRTGVRFVQPAVPVKAASSEEAVTELRYVPSVGPAKVEVQKDETRGYVVPEPGVKARSWISSIRERYRDYKYFSLAEQVLRQLWNNLNPGAATEIEETQPVVVEAPVIERPQGASQGERPSAAFVSGVVREGVQRAAGVAVKKAVTGVAAKAGEKVILTGAVTAATGGVGTVALVAADQLLSKAKVLWQEYGKPLAAVALTAYTGFLILLSKFGTAVTLGAASGGFIGAFFGFFVGNSVFPVIGGLGGAGIGFVVGSGVGGAVGAAVQLAGVDLSGVLGGLRTMLGGLWGGSGAATVGSSVAVTGSALMVGGVIVVNTIGITGTQNIAFSLDVEGAHDTMGEPAIFTVEKTSDTISLANTDTKTVTYTIRVIPELGQEIEIGEIHDVATAYGNYPPETIHDKKLTVQNGVYLYTDSVRVVASDIPDSNLINTVSVTATATDGQNQTQTAQTLITVGNPPAGGPYGFPVAGLITVLDDQTPFDNPKGVHCALMYIPSDTCTNGGLDIGISSGDVVSTADGHVFSAGFDCQVGGFIYLQSGPYRIAYIHLKKALAVKTDDPVKRGQLLGKVYDAADYAGACDDGEIKRAKGLQSSTGPHIHYQVVRVTTNLFFSQKRQEDTGQTNVGACLVKDSTGDLIKSMYIEPAFVTKPGSAAQGPLNCTE